MNADQKAELRTMVPAALRLFAVACASRVGGVVGHFGLPQTKQTFESVVVELWLLSVGNETAAAECTTLLRRIEACPEAAIDDCYRRGYYAMRGLGVLADAIAAVGGADAAAASDASDGAVSLAEDIAVEIGESHPHTTMPNGDTEGKLHARMLEELRSSPEQHVLKRIRQLSEQEPWHTELLPSIDLAHGWVKAEPES